MSASVEREMVTVKAVSAKGRELLKLWGGATAVAGLGTWIAFDAEPGINWGIWTLAAALGLAVFVRLAGRPLTRGVVTPLVLGVLLAAGAAVTASEMFYPLILMGSVALLAVAMLIASGDEVERVGGIYIAVAPIRAAAHAVVETGRRAVETAALARADRSVPAIRGIVLALPVVVLFGLLLSGADPLLAAWRDALVRIVEEWSFVPRLIFFGMLGVLTLGTYGAALRPRDRRAPWLAPLRPLALGSTERVIILASVDTLFALFLALQLSYLFGNAPAVQGSGVTFADYARRGFGELTVVATLCTMLILAIDPRAERGARYGMVRGLEMVVIVELQLLLLSAYHRLSLYEGAYGYTRSRLYAQVYMFVVSGMLLMLAYEVWKSLDLRRLTRRVALVSGGALTALTYWNHEAWIARQNLRRFAETGKLDPTYLARGLSLNAAPVLAEAVRTLPGPERTELRSALHYEYNHRFARMDEPRWYEWNYRRAIGVYALRPVIEQEQHRLAEAAAAEVRARKLAELQALIEAEQRE